VTALEPGGATDGCAEHEAGHVHREDDQHRAGDLPQRQLPQHRGRGPDVEKDRDEQTGAAQEREIRLNRRQSLAQKAIQGHADDQGNEHA